jgi:hypothetical protein
MCIGGSGLDHMARTILAFLVMLLWGSTAPSAPPELGGARSVPDIVVQARPERALRPLLEALAPSRMGRQLARWDDRVCTRIFGLKDPYATFVKQRIDDLARALTISVAQSNKCQANVIVTFTLDADALTGALIRNYPELAGEVGRGAVNKRSVGPFLAPHPVRWLGVDLVKAEELPIASRLKTNSRQIIGTTYSIVDLNDLRGVTWNQLADFLAFVSLARPEFDRTYDDPGTILSLFTARDAGLQMPDGLTSIDRNFLRSLYRTDARQTAEQQRQDIRRQVKAALAKDDARP